jgi:O-antigen/teichoic acid export membrane protein
MRYSSPQAGTRTSAPTDAIGQGKRAAAMQVRRNSVVNALGAGARLLIALAAQPLLVRLLGLEQYGVWVILLALLNIGTLAECGLSTALTTFLAAARARDDRAAAEAFLGTTLVALTAIGLAVAVGGWYSATALRALLLPERADDAATLTALHLLALGLLPRLWQLWLCGWEQGLGRFDLPAIAESAHQIALTGGIVVLAWFGQGIVAFAWWQLAASLAAIGLHWFLLRRAGAQRPRWRWHPAEAPALLRFALAHWFSRLGGLLFSQADRLLVKATLGLEAAGLYTIAVSFASKINELSAIPLQPVAPAVGAAQARGDTATLRAIFDRALRLNALLVYALAATLAWVAPWIGQLVVPPRADDLSALIQILAFAYAVYSLNAAGYFYLIGLRASVGSALAIVAGAGATLGLIWLLATASGLRAAAAANIGFAVTLAIPALAGRHVGITPPRLLARLAPCLLSLLACALLCSLTPGRQDAPLLLLVGIPLCLLPCLWIAHPETLHAWRWARGRLNKRLAT